MTPKEKAKELVDKYLDYTYAGHFEHTRKATAKQCALIAADQMIPDLREGNTTKALNSIDSSRVLFCDKVKEEIKKL